MTPAAPSTVVYGGRLFRRAFCRTPYRGVAAQYREDRPRDSGHMFLLDDGTLIVPHVDAWNPDSGIAGFIMHSLVDDWRTTLLVLGGVAAGAWLVRRHR